MKRRLGTACVLAGLLGAGACRAEEPAAGPGGAPPVPSPGTPEAEVSADGRLSLDGTWRFALAPDVASAERLAGFCDPAWEGPSAGAFRPLPVPANWALHGFEEPVYLHPSEAEGFYLRSFRVPADVGERRAVLHFDGVWASAEVWLNGRSVGRHDGGFTAFAFDVTRLLDPGRDNRLAVRVRQRTTYSALDVNDDWALGGIYRGVWIEFMPRALYIDRVEAVPEFDAAFRDADLRLRVFVGNPADKDVPAGLRATLTGPDGREAARASFDGVVPWGGREIPLALHVESPVPWTAETPALYDLRVDLVREGRVVHARIDRIGFRTVSTAGGVLRVNGRPVKLRGVCRHDQHPDVGRATREEHWRQDIKLMKDANINAVRTSHYPPAEDFIRLCDELGLYVIEEVPMGYGDDLRHDPAIAGNLLQRAYETVARDRNRPSVIVWSIGNEDPVTALHLTTIRAVKGLDPTRPVLMPWHAEDDVLPPDVDILAPHYKSAKEYDALAAKARRPVITTEYSHSLGDADFGDLALRWRALTKHPAGAGAMIWDWADQGLRRQAGGRKALDPLNEPGYPPQGSDLVAGRGAGPDEIYDTHGIYGTDGLVYADRTPQRDFWEAKAVYAPVTVPVESVTVAPGAMTASIPVRNEFDFTNLDAIGIRWTLMDEDRELASGDAKAAAPPGEGGSFEVPVDRATGPGCFVLVSFRRADGSEIVRRSVRLASGAAAPAPAVGGGGAVSVSEDGDTATARAGPDAFGFDRKSGRLVSIARDGRTLVTGARLALWRPLTLSEGCLLRGNKLQKPPPPDLDRYQATVKRWRVVREGKGARIETELDCRVDDRNGFEARIAYDVGPDGLLRVSWAVANPRFEAKLLPEIGLELETAPDLDRLRWRGLGPLDAYPNKREAAIFGVWSGRVGTPDAFGTKAGVEWAELTDGKGAGLRVTDCPYVRLEGDGKSPGKLRLLSLVAGRPTKFNWPERPEDRIGATPEAEFKGGFALRVRER